MQLMQAVENVVSGFPDSLRLSTSCELIEAPEFYGVSDILFTVNDYIVCRRTTQKPSLGGTREGFEYVILYPDYWLEYGAQHVDWRHCREERVYQSDLDAIGAAIGLAVTDGLELEGQAAEMMP